jgi:hypothetical protein
MQLGLGMGEAIPRLPLEPYQKLTEPRLYTLRKINQGRVVKSRGVSVSGANIGLSIVNHFAYHYSSLSRTGRAVYIKLKAVTTGGTRCSCAVGYTGISRGWKRVRVAVPVESPYWGSMNE